MTSERAAAAQQANLHQEAELLCALCAQLAEFDSQPGHSELGKWSALGGGAARLAAQFGTLARGDVPVKIAVVGDFSSGKSSFINNLLEDKDLCPEYDDPTTSCVTSFAYGAKERIVRHEADGRRITLSRDKYRKQVQNRGAAEAEVRRFSFSLPLPLLRGVELLDTPGFNNPRNANDSEVTASIMAEADAFLYLVDVQAGAIAESGLARLRQIRSRANDAPIYLMLSKADPKSPQALAKLKATLQDKHKDLISGRIFCWSNEQARADFDTRADMAALFAHMRELKLFVMHKTLALAMRRHRDQRVHVEVSITAQLRTLMAQQLQLAESAENSLHTISERIDLLQSELGPKYVAEVRRAWAASFVAREIKGTGFMFCDAKIVLSSTPLPAALPTFSSSDEIRERLLVDTARHFKGRSKDLRGAITSMCAEAIAESVRNAETMLAQKFGPYAARENFDFDTNAQKEIDNVLKPIGGTLAAALWHNWQRWIGGLFALIEEEYVVPVADGARTRAVQLADTLARYQALVASAEPHFH